jgi:hypothetical protein
MAVSGARYHATSAPVAREDSMRRWLLEAGIIGAFLYPLSDIIASNLYPGFSYRDQAVSELFAIGAPTSRLVVILFTISSSLLFLFSIGVWMAANGSRLIRAFAVMMALNTVDALTLWNFFPMHMRGVAPTFTDTMHGLLAIDPFLLAGQILVAISFKGRLRTYTIATIAFSMLLILLSISNLQAFMANEPTPWMGIKERAGQYANNLWYAVIAVALLRSPANNS